jgi:hypothetical protein
MTILSFTALFVGLGITGGNALGAATLTAGVFAGSSAWWVVLITGLEMVRSRLSATAMRRINIGSGLLIGSFAVIAIGSALVP